MQREEPSRLGGLFFVLAYLMSICGRQVRKNGGKGAA